MVVIYPTQSASAQVTRRVAPSTGTNVWLGLPNDCIVAPCATLGYAVNVSANGDTILLENTTFYEYNIVLNKDLNLVGYGPGQTIFDANTLGRHFSIPSNATVSLHNLRLTEGLASVGGSILNSGELSISSSNLDLNYADNGGAIYNGDGATLTLSVDTLLDHNYALLNGAATGNGGAIYNDIAAEVLLLSNTQVVNNWADTLGGAIYNSAGTVNISESFLHNNVGTQNGGGIFNNGGGLFITASTFDSNSTSGNGGAINNLEGIVTIDFQSTLLNNAAVGDGGAIHNGLIGGDVTIRQSVVYLNTADRGGAVFNTTQNGAVTIVNSTVSENSAVTQGGVLFNAAGTLTTANTTLSTNSAPAGATVFNNQSLRLSNSIITNSVLGSDCVNQGGTVLGKRNLVDDHAAGGCSGVSTAAVTDFDTNLALNGGLTLNHALGSSSNAVDSGFNNCPDPASGLAPLNIDQRQFARPNVAAGAVCDIGAYELQ